MELRTLADGRILLDSGSPWEPVMGYSRAVRVGDMVMVSGCVGLEPGGGYSADLSRQTARCLERLEEALLAFGADLGHIVRLRISTTRIERWREIATVVGPRFGATRPANTLLGVSALVDAAALIEIEADAWVAPGGDGAPVARASGQSGARGGRPGGAAPA